LQKTKKINLKFLFKVGLPGLIVSKNVFVRFILSQEVKKGGSLWCRSLSGFPVQCS